MDSSFVLTDREAEYVGTCDGKNLWKLFFQCLRFLSKVGGMAINSVKVDKEELLI